MRDKLWEERPKLTSRHAKDFPDHILQQDGTVRGDLGFANNFPISSFISQFLSSKVKNIDSCHPVKLQAVAEDSECLF